METVNVPEVAFIRIRREGDPGRVRRQAEQLAKELGFPAARLAEASLVATEMATNLLHHAKNGIMLVQPNDGAVELVSIDEGPGVSHPRFFEDGHSSRGTMGAGFGTMKRLSNQFHVDTEEHGTVIVCRIWPDKGEHPTPRTGAVVIGLETQSGDAWSMRPLGNDGVQICAVDGAGHGERAAKAAQHAIAIFHGQLTHDPVQILSAMHEELRGTRGAAVTIANISGNLAYAGIGNVDGRWMSDRRRGVMARPGTMGSSMSSFRPSLEQLEGPGDLVLCSDGLKSSWSESINETFFTRDPTCKAATLVRDHQRKTDDCMVIVHLREP